jgi:hypothetical protein
MGFFEAIKGLQRSSDLIKLSGMLQINHDNKNRIIYILVKINIS